jgi:hypothetical protein
MVAYLFGFWQEVLKAWKGSKSLRSDAENQNTELEVPIILFIAGRKMPIDSTQQ